MPTSLLSSHYTRDYPRPVQIEREAKATAQRRTGAGAIDDSKSDTSARPDWNLVAVWLFSIVCFAALGFAIYAIWAKCCGGSPV